MPEPRRANTNLRLLALDTANEACSVAYLEGDMFVSRHAEIGRGHAEHLLPMVQETLLEAGAALSDLDALAVGVGPGSFTGVRIGVAAAQGLAFGAGLRVVPVSSLECLAYQALALEGGRASRVLACLDARMHEVYWQLFEPHELRGVAACGQPHVSTASAVERFSEHDAFGIGRGIPLVEAAGRAFARANREALPRALDAARLAGPKFALGEHIAPDDLAPLYVRDRVAQTMAERAARMS